MDRNSPPFGDLNELERRLAGWQPATAGLDRDRMLFAAGRNSASRGWKKLAWPALTGSLAILATVLGISLVRERAVHPQFVSGLKPARLDIHHRHVVIPDNASGAEPPAPASYLATSHLLSDGLDQWPILAKVESPGPSSADQPILRATSTDDVFDP